MFKSRIATAALMVGAVAGSKAWGLESHGYFRSGIGSSRGGTEQVCFRDPGADGASGKFRLGNECETYIELLVSEAFQAGDDKDQDKDKDKGKLKGAATEPHFEANVRVAMTSAQRRDWESSAVQRQDPNNPNSDLTQDFTTALREAYVEGVNVLGNGRSAWVGKRFYRRLDIHMIDYFFLENSGPGAGVEDIDVGIGKLQLAVLRDIPANIPAPNIGDGPAQTNTDIRLTDTPLPGGGNLTTVVINGVAGEAGSQSGKKTWQPLRGNQLALIHVQPQVLGGDNMVVVQYGQGLYGADAGQDESTLSQYGASGTQAILRTDDGLKKARDKSSTLRLIEHLVVNPTPALSAEFVALYEKVDFGGASQVVDQAVVLVPQKTEIVTGIRPVIHLDRVHDLAFEYGYTRVKNVVSTDSNGNAHLLKAPTLQKFTVAPQITSGPGYFGRPQLRLFATYAAWNADGKGSIGGTVYAGNTSGFSTGAQVETWW